MRAGKIASVVVAAHLIALAFFFFKPPVNYFVANCLSTVIVWPAAFAFSKRKKWAGIIAASLLQLAIQQVAYHAWVSVQAAVWWPLAQFIALQYVIALRIGSPQKEA